MYIHVHVVLVIIANKISKYSSISFSAQYILISSFKQLSCPQVVYFNLLILYKNNCVIYVIYILLFATKFGPSIPAFCLISLFGDRRVSYVIVIEYILS